MEYLVVGAGAPVDPSRAHVANVPHGSSKFYWARSADEREACKADPDCRFDTTINDGSFAYINFQDADLATVEIVTHHGEVVYTLTKPNPRSNEAATGYDHTQDSALHKRYVPYRSTHLDWIETVPGVCSDSNGVATGHSDQTTCIEAHPSNTWSAPVPGYCVDHRGQVRVFERTCAACKTAAACSKLDAGANASSSDLMGAMVILVAMTAVVGMVVGKKLKGRTTSEKRKAGMEEGIYSTTTPGGSEDSAL